MNFGDIRAGRRPPRFPAAAAAAALLAISCAANHAFIARPTAEPLAEPPAAESIRAPPAPSGSEGRPVLVSQWVLGRCRLEGNELSYSDDLGSRSGALRLDSEIRSARRLLCSDGYTVAILQEKAIISLGGDGIIEGREMLGFMGGRFIPANSVEVDLDQALESGAAPGSAILEGRELSFPEPDGRRWRLDVSDPFAGWRIY